jgi:hypothetical protein
MELPTPVEGLLQAELRCRYERLRSVHGAVNVAPPTAAVIAAFVEKCKPAQMDGAAAIRKSVHDAGDIYEYIVCRWQDPRWREMLLIAREMKLLDDHATPCVPSMEKRPRFRSCGSYSREAVLAGAEAPEAT